MGRKRRLELFPGADLQQCPVQGWGHQGQHCRLEPAEELGYEALNRAAE